MGKARIVSGGTEGLYTVELLHNRDRINAEIETLNARITALEEELAPLETEREELVAERNAIASEIDQAVDSAAEDEIPDVEALLVELSQVSAQIQSIDVRIAMLQGRILQAKQRRTMLQSIPADPQQSAWCADFTEDLTGEVGTVDLPGEGTVGEFLTWRRVIVRPGYGGAASYAAGRDGQMHFREGQSPEQAFFNAAILPGWQKWMPLHRIATITAIDKAASTCVIGIQSEDSSAQNLNIDQWWQLSQANVPIEYMDCNAAPFEVGDRVLVEFQGQRWDQPRVIGFESNPRPCDVLRIFDVDIRVNKNQSHAQPFTGGGSVPCSGAAADIWYSRLPFSSSLPAEFLDIFYRHCDFSLSQPNYETNCRTTAYSLPSQEMVALEGMENDNISSGTWIRGQVVSSFQEYGATLYSGLEVDHSNYGWTSLYDPGGGRSIEACVSAGSVANVQQVIIPAESIPEIGFDGDTFEAVGFIRITHQSQSPEGRRITVAVLCRKIDV